jgi:hypothetical protein
MLTPTLPRRRLSCGKPARSAEFVYLIIFRLPIRRPWVRLHPHLVRCLRRPPAMQSPPSHPNRPPHLHRRQHPTSRLSRLFVMLGFQTSYSTIARRRKEIWRFHER